MASVGAFCAAAKGTRQAARPTLEDVLCKLKSALNSENALCENLIRTLLSETRVNWYILHEILHGNSLNSPKKYSEFEWTQWILNCFMLPILGLSIKLRSFGGSEHCNLLDVLCLAALYLIDVFVSSPCEWASVIVAENQQRGIVGTWTSRKHKLLHQLPRLKYKPFHEFRTNSVTETPCLKYSRCIKYFAFQHTWTRTFHAKTRKNLFGCGSWPLLLSVANDNVEDDSCSRVCTAIHCRLEGSETGLVSVGKHGFQVILQVTLNLPLTMLEFRK